MPVAANFLRRPLSFPPLTPPRFSCRLRAALLLGSLPTVGTTPSPEQSVRRTSRKFLISARGLASLGLGEALYAFAIHSFIPLQAVGWHGCEQRELWRRARRPRISTRAMFAQSWQSGSGTSICRYGWSSRYNRNSATVLRRADEASARRAARRCDEAKKLRVARVKLSIS